MKKNALLFIGLLLLLGGTLSSKTVKPVSNDVKTDAITLVSSPDLLPFSQTLVRAYSSLYPAAKIEVKTAESFDKTPVPKGENELGFISQKFYPDVETGKIWNLLVARDVVVPVFNAQNPFAEFIQKQGMSPQKLKRVLVNKNLKNWGTILDGNQPNALHVYVSDEEVVKSAVEGFVSPGFSDREIGFLPAGKIIQTVAKDKYAIGFCRLNDILDAQMNLPENIALLPIDNNNNGRLDYNEQIYSKPENLQRAIWIGKYPHVLITKIFAVAPEKPSNKAVTSFLNWIVTDGQELVQSAGYTELVFNERQSKLDKLVDIREIAETPKTGFATSKILPWLIAIAALSILFLIFVRRRKGEKAALAQEFALRPKVINEDKLVFPGGLYFDKSHTWVFMEKNGRVRFGIDDFLPNVTGKYTRVSLKNPGEKVKRKEPIVTLIRNGKQIDIHAPVSGTIKDINETLVTDPDVINSSPYEKGWVYMIEPSNWQRELKFFSLGEKYKKWIINEFARLKDFLACSFNIKNLSETEVAFQEGGELTRFVLQDMEPQLWEDFQKYFIDTSEMY